MSLQTSWNRGRRLVEEECEFIKPILKDIECAGADMLSPSGTLLFNLPDDPEDIDKSLEDPPGAPVDMNLTNPEATDDADLRVEVEDHLGEGLDNNVRIFDTKITIKGIDISKAQALAKYSKT